MQHCDREGMINPFVQDLNERTRERPSAWSWGNRLPAASSYGLRYGSASYRSRTGSEATIQQQQHIRSRFLEYRLNG